MRTIGFRASPDQVCFAIYDATSGEIINIEQIFLPIALDIPRQLRYLRTNIIDILREYGISRAGIRTTEPNSRSLSINRIQIEGVIQETFSSSSIEAYYVGQISRISARIGIRRDQFKQYIDGTLIYERVERWTDLGKIEREAVLTAIGATND